jgi:acetyltransferase-like isoleucine patch superfamily enzyme
MIKKIKLGNNSYFIGEEFKVGANFKIGNNNIIKARSFICGDNVTIGSDNNFLVGKNIYLGPCSYIGDNNQIEGLSIKFGDYLYLDSNVVIGHGGKFNYDSELIVGNKCMICSYVKLNLNYKVEIGDEVGIGEYVDIWTHGSFPPVLMGYPAQFDRVKIGSNVWLPAKSTVMPGVNIGDNVVIGANSVINKNLPTGSLCAGIPVKILREGMYPKELSLNEKISLLDLTLKEYNKLLEFKCLDIFYKFNEENFTITLDNGSVFLFDEMKITGKLDEKGEDLRDFLRRRGMKFFNGKVFQSITPTIFKDLMSYE